MQQPQWAKGTTQQQFNREVEFNMKQLSDSMQSLTDTLKARSDETIEIGKLIQQELDRNSDDVEVLRQKVNKLQAESQAKKDMPVEHQQPLWPFGAGILIVAVGILAVNCIRLWFDMRMLRLVPGFIPHEEIPSSNHAVISENARPVPDPAIR